MTRVELISKLGQMQHIESFEVTETTLEQIFQEQIKTKEQKEKTKDEL